MMIKKVDAQREGETLFAIENKAFCRDFDLPPRTVSEEVGYLNGSEVFVVYDGTVPIGIFAYKKSGKTCEIKTVAVIPEYQRKGIGSKIMESILTDTRKSTLWLVVHPKNTSGLMVYLKSGFIIESWIPNYYGDGQPRLKLVHKDSV